MYLVLTLLWNGSIKKNHPNWIYVSFHFIYHIGYIRRRLLSHGLILSFAHFFSRVKLKNCCQINKHKQGIISWIYPIFSKCHFLQTDHIFSLQKGTLFSPKRTQTLWVDSASFKKFFHYLFLASECSPGPHFEKINLNSIWLVCRSFKCGGAHRANKWKWTQIPEVQKRSRKNRNLSPDNFSYCSVHIR